MAVDTMFKRFDIDAKIRRVYERVFPLEKVFYQYPPKPMQIPAHLIRRFRSIPPHGPSSRL